MRFLPGLFSEDGRHNPTRRFSQSNGLIFGTHTPYRTSWSTDRAVREGFERVVWVWKCVDAIAKNQARLPMIFREGDPDTGDVIAPSAGILRDLHKCLNRKPNPHERARDFRYRLSAQLLLSKQGVFVELVRNNRGGIAEMYLLPPQNTAPIPDPIRFVAGYEVTTGGRIDVLSPDQVLWIKNAHPTDPYMSSIPMEAVGLSVDLDWYARLYNRNFMANDGRPGGVLAVKSQLDPDDAEELRRRFGGGPTQTGRISVIEADSLEYKDFSVNPRDMSWADLMKVSQDEILIGFGVPKSQIGDASGRTFDNADAEEEMFWRQTMLSHNSTVFSNFDSLTEGGETDDLFCTVSYASVFVLERDERTREIRFLAMLNAGAITLDEFREATGREPVRRPGSTTYFLPQVAIASSDSEQSVVNGMLNAGLTSLDVTDASGVVRIGNGRATLPEIGAPTSTALPELRIVPALPPVATLPPGAKALSIHEIKSKSHANSAIVAFSIPIESGGLLVQEGGEPVEELHVTLVTLTDDVIRDSEHAVRIEQAVHAFAASAQPVRATISGAGIFQMPDGTSVLYASVDAPDLPRFRERLATCLEATGFSLRIDHGFTPHITLRFYEADETPIVPTLPAIEFKFNEISLHWGNSAQAIGLHGGVAVA